MPTDPRSLARRLDAASSRVDRSLMAAHRAIAASVRRHLRATASRAPEEYRRTVEVSASDDGVSVTTSHPAAQAFERGGERIQGSPWVAVPVSAAARATGDPRHDGALVSIRDRSGRVYLISRATAEVRWRLVQSVQTATQRPVARAMELSDADVVESTGDAIAAALGFP